MVSANITHQSYEDPEVVAEFARKKFSKTPKQASNMEFLVQNLAGKRVLDLGCGPGHDAYFLARLGCEVTGLDYSAQMINQAKQSRESSTLVQPDFMVGDMLQLTEYFPENHFDGVWASASLLHVRKENMPALLTDLHTITKPEAMLYISLKQGEGTEVIREEYYGKTIEREFTFWQETEFETYLHQAGFKVEKILQLTGRVFQGKPTQWSQFFVTKR